MPRSGDDNLPKMNQLIGQDQVCHLMGYERPGDALRKLTEQGVRVVKGRPGFWFVTLDALNRACGISPRSESDDQERVRI